MPVSSIAQILLRLFALSWILTGFIQVASFILLSFEGLFSLFSTAGPIIYFVGGIILWVLAPGISRFISAGNDGEVSLTDSLVTPFTSARPLIGNHPLGWSEDGRSLYWQLGSDLYRWYLEEDEKELLVTLPKGQKWIGFKGAMPGAPCQPRSGTDPLEFVCAIDESVTELFLVDLDAGGD